VVIVWRLLSGGGEVGKGGRWFEAPYRNSSSAAKKNGRLVRTRRNNLPWHGFCVPKNHLSVNI
jgi:hypothetical protein